MGNILNTTDIVNSIKTIDKDCEKGTGYGQPYGQPSIDYEKFYNRVKGLMSLVEENLGNKKGEGFLS
jgi:hypothetical protein